MSRRPQLRRAAAAAALRPGRHRSTPAATRQPRRTRVTLASVRAAAERIEVFFNSLAHATEPDLGRVAPRLNVSAASAAPSQGGAVARTVALQPGDGHVLVDYVSALPADGGIASA